MRQQRAKRYRKAMALYQTSFNFREPYQVLLSSDFILTAHRLKLNLVSLLQRTFQASLKLSNSPPTHISLTSE
jgi:U3 small nucleolar RNA-associated protein 23